MTEPKKPDITSNRGCAALIGICSAGLLVVAILHWREHGMGWRVVLDGLLAVMGIAFMVDVLARGKSPKA